MIEIKKFEREDISKVIEFEEELRRQEPDTYYWNPDEKYVSQSSQHILINLLRFSGKLSIMELTQIKDCT